MNAHGRIAMTKSRALNDTAGTSVSRHNRYCKAPIKHILPASATSMPRLATPAEYLTDMDRRTIKVKWQDRLRWWWICWRISAVERRAREADRDVETAREIQAYWRVRVAEANNRAQRYGHPALTRIHTP